MLYVKFIIGLRYDNVINVIVESFSIIGDDDDDDNDDEEEVDCCALANELEFKNKNTNTKI